MTDFRILAMLSMLRRRRTLKCENNLFIIKTPPMKIGGVFYAAAIRKNPPHETVFRKRKI